jgi:diguanylate cyclase (GGDEF)-like protein
MGQRDDHSELEERHRRVREDPQRWLNEYLELSSAVGEELADSDPHRAEQILADAADEAAGRPAEADGETTLRLLRIWADVLTRLDRPDDARDVLERERVVLDRRVESLEQLIDARTRQLEQALIDLRDVTDRSQLDPLTGLAGRSMLRDAAAELARRGGRCSVLAIDLDRFGRLNETLGHQIGDDLLAELAGRLQRAVRPRDTVARWGGDEFMVLMPGVHDITAATAMAEVIRQTLALPFRTGVDSVVASISVGIAIASDGLADPDELLRQADLALERAKALGKGRVEVFGAELGHDARRRFDTEHLLRDALEEGRFELYFQPVHSNTPGEPMAAEALLRLHHPDGRILAPGAFLDVAEETGLARPIGTWVLEETCRLAAEWQRDGHDFRVAVNVSASQLVPGFATLVHDTLLRYGVDPSVLVIELTEHLLLDADDEQVAMLVDLRAEGVRIALDDFGTAYSSLTHLRRFPVDVVKIDRSFVAGICRSDQDYADLSRTFHFRVIAEGVETTEQLDQQRRLGCHGAQGFLIGEPRPAGAFADLLSSVPLYEALSRAAG